MLTKNVRTFWRIQKDSIKQSAPETDNETRRKVNEVIQRQKKFLLITLALLELR